MRWLSFLGVLAFWGTAFVADGSLRGFHQVAIDFRDEADASAKASWTPNQRVNITGEGLGWDGDPASRVECSVRTKPIAVGLSWRPPQQAGVTVTLDADRSAFTLNSGQETRPYQGQVYVRFSPDLKHFSTWHVGNLKSVHDGDKTVFGASVGVPRSVRKPYADLLQTYYDRKVDLPASYHEGAAVRWIVDRQPGFFANQIPFVGYVQVMYEGNFGGDRRLRSMRVDIGYGMSGFGGPAAGPNLDRRWRYVADGIDATGVIEPVP